MSDTAQLSEAKRLLLQKMLAGGNAPRAEGVSPVSPRAPGTDAPISAEQMNVWVHAAMTQDVPLYNEAITIHHRGPLDVALLERSFDEILRRHESWRSCFSLVDGEVRQIVVPECPISFPLTDLSDLPPAEREAEALRLAIGDARKPFDLAQAPLLRGRVIRMAAGEHRIYLALHHIIFDGVSLYQVMVPELAAIYAAYEAGTEPPCPRQSCNMATTRCGGSSGSRAVRSISSSAIGASGSPASSRCCNCRPTGRGPTTSPITARWRILR